MGQYHKIVNLDKKQVLNPHEFTDGIKLLEFSSGGLTTIGLAVLLAVSNNRGGGDLHSDNEVIGSWGGDRIAIVGDYWENEETEGSGIPTWETIDNEYTDISRDVLSILCEGDGWIRARLLRSVARYDWGRDWSDIFDEEELKAERERQQKERE